MLLSMTRYHLFLARSLPVPPTEITSVSNRDTPFKYQETALRGVTSSYHLPRFPTKRTTRHGMRPNRIERDLIQLQPDVDELLRRGELICVSKIDLTLSTTAHDLSIRFAKMQDEVKFPTYNVITIFF
ncbi:unnamed protein product [Protopolystoma xenopodis]|uniref:Uncharacterized protein n=1 Tax=Protopolystoma xenopodis TaxID=117903 RepID=A0A3S5AIQ2_9PLAT|nr:unnamed protein product [Protopolystoma xenopodis]